MHRALVIAAIVVGGCSNDLPAASFIDKLRVLAVRAEPPEIAPGQTSMLDLLAVEPPVPSLGAPQPLTYQWLACALPSGSLTVEPCTTDAQPIGSGATASYTADANALGGAASTEVLITVVVADSADGAGGCLAGFAAAMQPTEPDHCVIALKRLTISAAPTNTNPTIDSFYTSSPGGFAESLTDGNGVWLYAQGPDLAAWYVGAKRADGAAELKPDGSYEALDLSWFTTAGHLDGGRSLFLPPGCSQPSSCAMQAPAPTVDDTWFAPTTPQAANAVDASGRVDFWAVIRDDRGGVGWQAGSLTLQR